MSEEANTASPNVEASQKSHLNGEISVSYVIGSFISTNFSQNFKIAYTISKIRKRRFVTQFRVKKTSLH